MRSFVVENILWVAFLFLQVPLYSQEPVSIHFSEKEGLPDKEFYDILEDKNGFIWLAADKGLFRYDGKDFKPYTNELQRGLSVFNLTTDAANKVWCNNVTGQFFYIEDDQLKLFIDLSDQLKGELPDFIINNDRLIVFALRTVYEVDISTKQIQVLIRSEHTIGTPFKFGQKIYFNNSNLIDYIDEDGFVKHLLDKKQPFVDADGITISQMKPRIFEVKESLFLFDYRSNTNTFFRFNIANSTFSKIQTMEAIGNEILLTIFEHENEVWFGTHSGVWVYQVLNDSFSLKHRFFKDYNITKILKDSEGNYWFTTKNNGVFAVPSIYIENHDIVEEEKNIVNLEKINDSLLAFGTATGNLGFYNTKTKSSRYLDIPSSYRVSAMKYVPHNNSLIISQDLNSYTLNLETQKLRKNHEINLQNVKSFSLINNDLLYTTSSLAKLMENSELDKVHRVISSNRRTYASHFCQKTNKVYIAYVDNIYVYDSLWKAKTVTHNDQPILGKCFTETLNEIIWVGTFKNGLIGIKNGEVVHHFNLSNGLTSNRINKIKGDGHLLWIALDNSIQLLNTETKKFQTLTKNDGIPTYDITGVETINNKVYFSSNIGLFSLDKERVFKEYVPEIYINEIEINESKVELKDIYQLEYDQNAVKIEFNVNGLYFNGKGVYQYRLKGYKDEWSTTDSKVNFVNYSSLPTGEYLFQVKPIISSENNNFDKVKEIQIIIRKPIWKQWWFIGVCSMFVLIGIVGYYKRKLKEQEKERASQIEKINLEKEVIASNLKALRSQMNPHFIFNSLNSIQDLVLKEDTEASYDYIVLFANLIRNTLNYSNRDFIPLEKELEFLNVYLELEKLRFGDDFEFEIDCQIDEKIEIPSLLIQPFIENALVHGLLHKPGGKHLSVFFRYEDILECIVIDNGVGRKKAQEIATRQGNTHESFAMNAIKQRLKVYQKTHNGNFGFTIVDLYAGECATGTKTIITMPFKKVF
ncbi:MAG: histidine kinase [Flavobacteriaceae bacterium]|nr:histidine kinase [Flavobacteriaceae bacterium]